MPNMSVTSEGGLSATSSSSSSVIRQNPRMHGSDEIIHLDVPMCEEASNISRTEVESVQSAESVVESSLQTSHVCSTCNKVYTKKRSLIRHERSHTQTKIFYKCEECKRKFTREEHLKRHFIATHPDIPYHLPQDKREGKAMQVLDTFSDYEINPSLEAEHDLSLFMRELRFKLHEHLLDHLGRTSVIKWYSSLICLMEGGASGDEIEEQFYFNSTTCVLLGDFEIRGQIDKAFAQMLKAFEEFTKNGSGWSLRRVVTLKLHLAKFIPFPEKCLKKSKKSKKSKRSKTP